MSTIGHIVQIGNSRGVRLPKHVLEASGLSGEVSIDARPGEVVLKALVHPRAGWAEAFAEMAQRPEESLLLPDLPSEWDNEEWSWPQ